MKYLFVLPALVLSSSAFAEISYTCAFKNITLQAQLVRKKIKMSYAWTAFEYKVTNSILGADATTLSTEKGSTTGTTIDELNINTKSLSTKDYSGMKALPSSLKLHNDREAEALDGVCIQNL
jgi:hypothetical protein